MELAKQLAESYRGIKFGRGVVGKTSHATLAIFGVWALVLFRLSAESPIFDACLVAGGVIVTAVYIWWVNRTHRFAKENPGLAMLEGAHFVEYQKWEAEIKGLPIPKSPLIPNPDQQKRVRDLDDEDGQ